jgi:hypothetical protein
MNTTNACLNVGANICLGYGLWEDPEGDEMAILKWICKDTVIVGRNWRAF